MRAIAVISGFVFLQAALGALCLHAGALRREAGADGVALAVLAAFVVNMLAGFAVFEDVLRTSTPERRASAVIFGLAVLSLAPVLPMFLFVLAG